MSIARHHADWLSLIEVSGPFVSLPVVQRSFPHGLPDLEPGLISEVRAAYADWEENGSTTAATHAAWVQYVLQRILGFSPDLITSGQTLPPGLEARVDTFHETLRPDFAILPPTDRDQRRPVLLVRVYPPQQRLESPLMGVVWKASPAARMMDLLHATDLPLGLVTNGEEWQLVFAPKNESTGFASWYADLWLQEPITLRAFQALLGQHRFFGVADDDTPAALLRASLKDQHEVTDSLGAQVRQAVELLVRDFDRLDIESNRALLEGLKEAEIYNASLTVMMRLVFLFCAEEKGLLRLGEDFYDSHYAVSTLRQQLREIADQRGEEVLERRSDAWCRLLATFRAVHGGVEHDAMRLPSYGGSLFDPDRYPFLEGRAVSTQWRSATSQPPHINNRVVLHLLEALQILRTKLPGGGPAEARRLSFRSLDIEQIGHVYEGLLDHTARRASAITLGLTGSSKSAAPLIKLEALESLAAKGSAALLDELVEVTGRSRPALEKDLGLRAATSRGKKKASANAAELPIEKPAATPQNPEVEHQLAVACGHDPRLVARVLPFAGLMRRDSFDQLLLIQEDSLHVAPGSERRNTGTHYTPRTLTEPIVLHTLEPLVYTGPAEGLPQGEWKLKSPNEILALKVCDMAMGSGAFLVQVCRYLAERLVEAWQIQETDLPQPDSSGASYLVVLPDGSLSNGSSAERLLPGDAAERIALARRYVADRCLYGVDINPMAVEMAKLSLWLITLQRDRPFTFLDHALKCGDSLLGVSSVKQIENFSLLPGDRQVTFATANLFRYVDEAAAKRRALEDLPSNDHTQIETKNRLHAEAEAATVKVKAVADCLIAFELRGLDGDAYEDHRTAEAERVELLITRDADAALKSPISKSQSALSTHAREQLRGRRPFHWAVEFPEVFGRGGFDSLVGNPPYLGAPKLTGTFGDDFREYLVTYLAQGVKGLADLCAYFVLRTESIMPPQAFCGLVVTSAIAEGDTRAVGLQQLSDRGWNILRATSRATWPGTASVTYSSIWLSPRKWNGIFILNNESVPGITPMLDVIQSVSGQPHRLKKNVEKSFNGVKVYGDGFVLKPEEASALIRKDARNKTVLFPYVTTKDINSHPTHQHSAWAIRFFDWPLTRESALSGYKGHVASDFPDCLAIVESRVKPERTRRDEKGEFVVRDPMPQLWWIYGEKRPGLYAAISKLNHVLAVGTQATKYVAFAVLDKEMVFSHSLSIIADDSFGMFAVLHATLHEVWARHYGGYNLALLRYSPTDLLETFPFPPHTETVEQFGRSYHEHRRSIMCSRQEGLTDTYNRFHDRGEQSADIAQLRALHVEMDQAVAAAYGWSDLDLGHGFHATKQGERYTLSEPARRTVLDRLLALNHQRYEEELKAGLHEKKKAKGTSKKTAKPAVIPAGPELKLDFTLLPKVDEWDAIGRPRPKTKEPLLYACSLVEALLSQNRGKLWMEDLQEAYLKVVAPMRLLRDTPSTLKPVAQRWAKWWSETEKAQNFHFRPALEQLAEEGKISAATPARRPASLTNPNVIQLNDGLSKPASEAVECDVRLVFQVHKPQPIPEDEELEFTLLTAGRVTSLLVAA